ncbi:MAG: hypothetical protein K2W91_02100 [Novosphingobium sp.]|nr:hypothetical protein [Novosphingobium sp.]
MANVIPFPSAAGECTPAELFLRIGEASYGKVASLYAEGRLPVTRAIIDASKLRHQLSFVKTLRDDGVELILDTKGRRRNRPLRVSRSELLTMHFKRKKCEQVSRTFIQCADWLCRACRQPTSRRASKKLERINNL